MSGLINRVIWVWPHWDRQNHEGKHSLMNLEIGWATVKDPFMSNRKTKAICVCEHDFHTEERACKYLDPVGDEDKGSNLSSNACFIKKSIVYEEVHEKVALNLTKMKQWISDKENVLLDIDEDYYGCDYSITPLLEARFPVSTISSINELVNKVFCPRNMSVEKEADKMLMKVISLLRKQSDCTKLSGKPYCKVQAEEILMKGFKNFSNALFCVNAKPQLNLKHLVAVFRTLKVKMLQALQSVGFCLSTTLKTYDRFLERAFRICHGHNTPQETAVLEHTPSLKEISNRTILMGQILSKLKMMPRLVTVCRSVRDGYTPRKYFETVERDVIQTLTKTYKHLDFYYDSGLLGGRKGWPHYHHDKYKNNTAHTAGRT